jgi:eukaryotic-like serine/threonine-protein kinase
MIGKVVSHYRILEKLGEGGMGVVYKAEDTALKRTVALKFLPPEFTFDPEAKQRFLHEAQAASALDHPNICTIYDVGQTEDGQTYIVMAYYEGQTLSEKIEASMEDGGLKIEDGIDVAIQVCQGLYRAHEAGIIHRDIKPANIMVTKRGEVKILDFGLAKLSGQSRLTKTGTTLGTAAYMSPEQARSEPIDQRSDLWSLGVVLYEMIAGQPPFKSNNEQALLYQILNEVPRPMRKSKIKIEIENEIKSEGEAEIPEALEQIVQKALAKKPEKRYQTAEDLLADLRIMKGGEETSELTLAGELAKKSARRKTLARLGLGAAVVAIAAVVYIFLSPILQESALASNPKTILIIPFENQTGDNGLDYLQLTIQDQLITSLEQSKYFRVVTRQRIMDLLKQMGKQGVDRVEHTLGLELCRREGAEVIIEGSFTRAGTLYATTARLLNTTTIQPLNTFTANGQGVESYLLTQIDKLSKDISNGLGIRRTTTEETLRPIAEVTTSSPEAYQLYLAGLDKIGDIDYAHARPPLEMAVQKDSNFVLAWLSLIEPCVGTGDDAAAELCKKKASSLARKATEQERFMIAEFDSVVRKEVMEGRPADEFEFTRYRAERFPKDKLFQVLWASMLFGRQGRLNEAIEVYTKALELDPMYRRALNELGYAYANAGLIDKSIETFKRYAAAHPGDANPYDSMGDIYRGSGREEEAIDAYKQALALNPDFAASAMNIAVTSFRREDFNEALHWIDRAIEITPATGLKAYYMNLKAYYLFWLGRLKEAQAELRAAEALILKAGSQYEHQMTEIEPWIAYERGDVRRARNLLRVRWTKDVINMLIDSSESVGRETELNYFLGLMDLKATQIDSAESRLKQIDKLHSQIKPGDSTLRSTRIANRLYERNGGRLRGELFLKKGLHAEALEASLYMKEGRESHPVPFHVFNTYIGNDRFLAVPQDLVPRAYVAMDSLDKAIAAYERAVFHTPGQVWPIIPRYHYRLAFLYEQKGLKDKAIAEYEKFLKIWGKADPIYKEPADARARLARLKRDGG